MADNVPITAGSGTSIATDDISSVQYQRIKLIHGADGVNDGDVSSVNPLPVETSFPQFWFELDVPGVAATSHTAGDQLGTLITITNAARVTGSGGFINAIIYHDNDDALGAIDVLFFNDTLTLAADDAPFAISDADARKLLYLGNITYLTDLTNQRYGQLTGISVPYFCTGTSLFVALIVRVTGTTSTSGQRIRFGLTRD